MRLCVRGKYSCCFVVVFLYAIIHLIVENVKDMQILLFHLQ